MRDHARYDGSNGAGNDRAGPDAPGVIGTGTTTVALTADGGVVLATDRRASVGGGRFVSNKSVTKVTAVHPTAAVTMSGGVGDLQSFARSLRAEVRLYELRRDRPPSMDALATDAATLLRGGPYRAARPTLGGVDATGPHVYDLDPGGAVLEADYVAGGSGMQPAYGVLETRYEAGAPLDETRTLAARAVESATERDTASGDGLCVATITDEDVTVETYADAGEVS